jgi:hypothetical protein
VNGGASCAIVFLSLEYGDVSKMAGIFDASGKRVERVDTSANAGNP